MMPIATIMVRTTSWETNERTEWIQVAHVAKSSGTPATPMVANETPVPHRSSAHARMMPDDDFIREFPLEAANEAVEKPSPSCCKSIIAARDTGMARYKHVDLSPRLLPVDLDAQLVPGSFAHAVHHLVDSLDLSSFDAHYCNDDTGASAHSPSMLLEAVLLGYSQGMVSSRAIERAGQIEDIHDLGQIEDIHDLDGHSKSRTSMILTELSWSNA
jgi:hypothetical protein